MNWRSILQFKTIGVVLALALTVTIAMDSVVVAKDKDGKFGQGYSKKCYGKKCLVDPILTDAGWVAGTMVGDIGKEVRVYRGIPYAAPPVGDLRWKPPQPAVPWEGIRECTQFGPWAPQGFPTPPDRDGIPEEGMSEDCLHLNVHTPAKKTN